jgi:hypothetical protein
VDLLDPEAEASHAVEDLIRGFDPLERGVAVVMRVNVGEDGGAELRNARVRSAFERLISEESEEAFYQVEPRRVGRGEMKLDARMTQQPSLHGRRAMRGEIVEDDVDVETGRDARVDLAEKGHEVLRAMLGFAPGDHLAGRHIECGE